LYRLAIDVGNTNTVLGLFENGGPVFRWRVRTACRTPDELLALVTGLFRASDAPMPGAAAFACVAPRVTDALREFSRKWIGGEAVEVNPDTAGLEIDYPNPGELGPDRLANAAGALLVADPPVIVADFGTATTFDVIDGRGRFLGGAILPGVGTAASELFRRAERLNPLDLRFPEHPMGRSTGEAVRSGVLWGAVGAADRMVELLSGAVRGTPALLAAGGWAETVCPRCNAPFRIYPDLTLSGIDSIGRKKRGENG